MGICDLGAAIGARWGERGARRWAADVHRPVRRAFRSVFLPPLVAIGASRDAEEVAVGNDHRPSSGVTPAARPLGVSALGRPRGGSGAQCARRQRRDALARPRFDHRRVG